MQLGMVMLSDRRMERVYTALFHRLLGEELRIVTYILDDGPPRWSGKDSVRLITTASYSTDFIERIPTDRPIVLANLSFQKERLRELQQFPPGTRALLVSTTSKNAIDAISLLYQNRVNHIEFFPCYPGSASYPAGLSIAVTPGEPRLVPRRIKTVVDIGDRMPEVQAIIEVAQITGLEHRLKEKNFREYDQAMTGTVRDLSTPQILSSRLRHEYETIMNMTNIGLIGIDALDFVYACNRQAEFFLGRHIDNILYRVITEIIPGIPPAKESKVPLTFAYEKKEKRPLKITVTPMRQNEVYTGSLIMLLPAGEDEMFRNHLMERIMQKGHRARYHFSGIIGKSPVILHAVALAKMMADTDSAVLLTGESGTGKEMFAQSIHNVSPRMDKPFVAINCASIPDQLLESELFGYEEGSFTGAKRHGKIGLLEAANYGTIFLDEIGDMSLNLQAKLLRVIQERQIMRVGGDAIIPIDIRLISATNKDLAHLVKTGAFREDLYYRISTLPLPLPPLRERGADLFLILDFLCHALHASFVLTPEAKKHLAQYHWPGNIRELRNCVEYLCCLKRRAIEVCHLPPYIAGGRFKNSGGGAKNSEDDALSAVAAVLAEGARGRAALAQALAARGFAFSEGRIRKLLSHMKARGWITSRPGRGGSALTASGQAAAAKDRPGATEN